MRVIQNKPIVHAEISRKTLRQANRTLTVPFYLSLQDHAESLRCEAILRIIPGKRLVAFATWGDKSVVVKLFYDRKAKAHAHRDSVGAHDLQAAGILTPKIFFEGTARDKHIHVIVFERIFDAENLETIWQHKESLDEIYPLMHAVTIELATQHVLGILQHDLHFKNFLISENKIYTIDGSDIEKFGKPLDKLNSLNNLALFLAQLGVGAVNLQKKLFTLYTNSRGWITKPRDLSLLQRLIRKWQSQRFLRYQKKIFRNCTAFAEINLPNTIGMYDRTYESTELLTFLGNPDAIFKNPKTQILKMGRSATVAKVYLDKQCLVLKRYNIKGFWHGLRRCLRATRATNAWRLGHLLQLMNIPTATPIAFIEKRFLGLRGKSYLLTEFVEGPHIGEFFAENLDEIVAQRAVNVFKNLARLRMTHADLKMSNVLIRENQPVLIDLDGMREHFFKTSMSFSFKKSMRRFLRNWDNDSTTKNLFAKLLS